MRDFVILASILGAPDFWKLPRCLSWMHEKLPQLCAFSAQGFAPSTACRPEHVLRQPQTKRPTVPQTVSHIELGVEIRESRLIQYDLQCKAV